MNILALDDSNIEKYRDYIPEDIAQNLERYFFHGLIAVTDEGPVGGMMWQVIDPEEHEGMEKESTIIWLRIDDPDAAKSLFEFYKLSIDCEDVVRSTFSLPARNFQEGKEALLSAGFSVDLTEGDMIRASLSDILSLPVFKNIKPFDDIKPLNSLSQSGFNAAIRRFAGRGVRGVCEDLEYLPRDYFDSNVSCYCQIDDMIDGILLFHENVSGSLEIILLSAMGEEAQRIVVQMMKLAINNAKLIYKPDTKICIDRHNYMALALSERLFPSEFGVPVYKGSRIER